MIGSWRVQLIPTPKLATLLLLLLHLPLENYYYLIIYAYFLNSSRYSVRPGLHLSTCEISSWAQPADSIYNRHEMGEMASYREQFARMIIFSWVAKWVTCNFSGKNVAGLSSATQLYIPIIRANCSW